MHPPRSTSHARCHTKMERLFIFNILLLFIIALIFTLPHSCHARAHTDDHPDSSSSSPSHQSSFSLSSLNPFSSSSYDWIQHAWKKVNGAIPAPLQQRYQRRSSAATAGNQQQTQQQQQRHEATSFDTSSSSSSSSFINNPAPSILPSARVILPLSAIGDSSHYSMTLLVGTSMSIMNATSSNTTLLPDSTSQSLRFVIDTGMSDIIIYNRTICYGSSSGNQGPPCYTSSSYQPVTNAITTNPAWSTSLDGETYLALDKATALLTDLFTLPVRVLGSTSQFEYVISLLTFLRILDKIPPAASNLNPSSGFQIQQAPYESIAPTGQQQALINRAYYENVDGVMGLGVDAGSGVNAIYPQLRGMTAFQYLVNSMSSPDTDNSLDDSSSPSPSLPILSLDFSSYTLALNGIQEEYRSSLQWSTREPITNLYFSNSYGFRMFNLRVCDVEMFQNLTMDQTGAASATFDSQSSSSSSSSLLTSTPSWPVIIRTGSSCLGLPDEFYDMLISWLPIRCNLQRIVSNKDAPLLPYICYISSDIKPVILPTLSFKLHPQGMTMYISLTDLLFAYAGLNRLCVVRTSSIIGGATNVNAIVFGSKVLKQFYAVIAPTKVGSGDDSTTYTQIGLINKATYPQPDSPDNSTSSSSTAFIPSPPSINIQCSSRVTCSGMEVHYDPLNICLAPPCDDYYFFELDPEKGGKSCRLTQGFHITCGVIIGIFILAELGLHEAVVYLVGKAEREGIPAGN